MTTLGMWRLEPSQREETEDERGGPQMQPRPVRRSQIDLERHFEDWIANDPALI